METVRERNERLMRKNKIEEERKLNEGCLLCPRSPIFQSMIGKHPKIKLCTDYIHKVYKFADVLCNDCRVQLHINDGFTLNNGGVEGHCPECSRKYVIIDG